MAKFKKGGPGGPGRKKLPGDIKAARCLNSITVERIYHELLTSPQSILDDWVQDPTKSVLEVAVAKVMVEAIEGGDVVRLEKVLDRCVGKVQDKVKIEGPKPTVIKLSSGETLILGTDKDDE